MRVVIVGAGQYGYFITEKLRQENHDIAIIDLDQKPLNEIEEKFDVLTVKGNGASAECLLKAGIKEADMLIAITDSDEINIVSCSVAKYFGVAKKIARITADLDKYFPEHSESYLERFGIDFVVNPEQACADEFCKLILTSGMTEIMDFVDERIALGAFRITKDFPFLGTALKDLENPIIHNIRFVAISRKGMTLIPRGIDTFEEGDEVFFMCEKQSVHDVMTWVELVEHIPERVVIAGGNRIGMYLARELERNKIEVRLIERDQKRAEYLSDELNKTIVFRGDMTDPNVLEDLNLPDVDAFIAVTENDENNILSCVLSKQMLVKKTFCLVRRPEYIDLVSTMMKINSGINPKRVVINSIIRFIRSGNIASIASLREIEAEVVEVVIEKQSKLIDQRLADIDFPEGAIIGTIIRDEEAIFASGHVPLKVNDRLLVFYLPTVESKIRQLFGQKSKRTLFPL